MDIWIYYKIFVNRYPCALNHAYLNSKNDERIKTARIYQAPLLTVDNLLVAENDDKENDDNEKDDKGNDEKENDENDDKENADKGNDNDNDNSTTVVEDDFVWKERNCGFSSSDTQNPCDESENNNIGLDGCIVEEKDDDDQDDISIAALSEALELEAARFLSRRLFVKPLSQTRISDGLSATRDEDSEEIDFDKPSGGGGNDTMGEEAAPGEEDEDGNTAISLDSCPEPPANANANSGKGQPSMSDPSDGQPSMSDSSDGQPSDPSNSDSQSPKSSDSQTNAPPAMSTNPLAAAGSCFTGDTIVTTMKNGKKRLDQLQIAL
uniref:Uncharacterized protein n=1 Tax=Panagrolaimus superbus TaxID=310955 RepID=A0A914YTJ5_9BILA